jgi:hypothetical protein
MIECVGVRGRPPLRGTKDTDDNVSYKARFIFPASWGPGIRLTQRVSTRMPNAKFRLLLYFLDISHGHTAIFMAPGVTYF